MSATNINVALAIVIGSFIAWSQYRRDLAARRTPRGTSAPIGGRSPHRAVRIAMVLAVCVLGGLAVLGAWLGQDSLERITPASRGLDLAGRQRYLSQRMARLAVAGRTPAEVAAEATLLDVTAESTAAVFADWTVGGSQHGVIVGHLTARADSARALMLVTARNIRTDADRERLGVESDAFLGVQDSLVRALSVAARAEVEALRETGKRFAFLILTVLLGIVMLVLEPIVRLLQRQHEAQSEQAQAFERLSLVATRTSNAVVITDAERRITWVNDAFTAVSGYTLADVVGKSPGEILQVPGRTDPNAVAALRQALDAQTSVRATILNQSRSGRPYWLDLSIEPLFADGALTGFIAVESDVTEQVEARETLASERKALVRLAAQAEEAQVVARVGNWEFDLASQAIEWSSGVYWLFGRTQDLGTPNFGEAMAGYAPSDSERLQQAIGETLRTGEPYGLILRTSAANPEVRFVRADGRARRGPDGTVAQLFGTVTDVTAAVELEERLRAASGRAEAASHAKSEFLANMSHEIRTPLTVILGYTDVLRDRARRDPALAEHQGTIDTVRRAGEHLLTVINDILDISKIEAGRMTMEQLDTDISAVLRDVESLMRPRAIGKGVALAFYVRTPIPSRIMTDPTRLRQILVNLVGNATKFTEQGRITVEVSRVRERGEDLLRIAVEDSGIGMDPEAAVHLFQPFAQADNSVTRRFGGTGLGLAICRRLAELMGGDVVLSRTAPGQGSRFELSLPLRGAEDAEEICELSSAISATIQGRVPDDALAGRRILLAEDGEDNQRLLSIILEAAGAEVRVAENGRIALDILSATTPAGSGFDLLLTDMQMPEMDGYTLASHLRAIGSDIPIVALTAHAMAEDRQRCLEAGCDDYASKPIERLSLIETCARRARVREGGVASEPASAASASSAALSALSALSVLRSEHESNPLLGRLVATFAVALPDRVGAIVDALARGDETEGARLLHQLKGSAGSYGYPDISATVAVLETAAKSGDASAGERSVRRLTALADAARRGVASAS